MTRAERLKTNGIQLEYFKYEDRFFVGNLELATNDFINQNPEPSDFYVWLQNNCIEIKF